MMIFYWSALIIVSLAFVALLYRLIKGPTIADRVVALDALGVSLVSIVALLSMILKTEFFFEIILLLSILSFIGTAAFAKFIERGVIFDRGNNR
ncbi:Na(+)/H(+) antiporter subunit F1 [Planococcus sp. N028]|uniref:Na(+)/H(+) antiporter subunit F1 n=1 Tax=Planococcus shixiaomingii TaxID=3058393 RepID=A0ABT8N6U1_9BACL|nr:MULTISPECIES: Na(+)/H(+) antiporter subunit F1 [unclassified Planococcus (in: firmicutes)]MDN7243609.1 Na(+)/H(+) antiporter subunit F1 [Planococcus sp. N028]WKA56044.1 Na(+)/H(+) antiporter subunit F1 [Planococcus sp. N022]